MGELTIDQHKALALAKARVRLSKAAPVESDGPSVTEDVLKSGGIGLAKGAIALPGMLGDAQSLTESMAAKIAGIFGADENTAASIADGVRRSIPIPGMNGPKLPTSADLQQGVESVTGEFYKPKTTYGEFAETGGEFLPAILAGPGGVGRKLATTVASAFASEGAGQATEGTALEPYARVVGALAGGGVTAGKGGKAMKQVRQNAPDHAAVKQMADAKYTQLRDAGIQYDPNDYRGMVMKVADKLYKHGWRPNDGSGLSDDIKDLVGRLNKPNDFSELDILRRRVGKLPGTAAKEDVARAAILREAIGEFINNGKVVSTKGMSPDEIAPLVKEARELARRNIIVDQIKDMEGATLGYLGGDESALRNQFGSYLKNKGKRKGLTDTERKAFSKVVRREGVMNATHAVGSRIGQLVLGGSVLTGGLGIPGALATMGLHYGARKGMEAYTKKGVRDALATALAGQGAQLKASKADKILARELMARRLIPAVPATQSGR